MITYIVDTITKKFSSGNRVPEFYAKQLAVIAVKFDASIVLSKSDMIYFVADTDFAEATAPAIPQTFALPEDIDTDTNTVVFRINTNTPRYNSAVKYRGQCLNAEIRIKQGECYEPLMYDKVLGSPFVVDPDAPPQPTPHIGYVQTVNELTRHVRLVDPSGAELPTDPDTNTITVRNYTPGDGITITGNEIAVDTVVMALKTDLDVKVDKADGYSLMSDAEHDKLADLYNYDDTEIREAIESKPSVQDIATVISDHNESGTAHNDIRVELGHKADTSDVTTALENKVDKVEGKGLSTNDYDNTDKSKVDALGSMATKDAADYRTAADQDVIDGNKLNKNQPIVAATSTKVTYDEKGLVLAGASLSEEDIPDLFQSKITGLGDSLLGKVDKVEGKELSENDFTDAYVEAIEDLQNEVSALMGAVATHDGSEAAHPAIRQQVADLENSLATVAKSGNYADLTGKPSIPSDLSQLTDSTSKYYTAAQIREFDMSPGSSAQEVVEVGASKKFKTLHEAVAYMMTKGQVMNKSFRIVVDPGTYEGADIALDGLRAALTATVPSNKPIFNFKVTFTRCTYVLSTFMVFNKGLHVVRSLQADIVDCDIHVPNNADLTVSHCHLCAFTRCTITSPPSGTVSVVVAFFSSVSISTCTITGGAYGVNANQQAYVTITGASSIASDVMGIMAQGGACIYASVAGLTIDAPTPTSPAPNTLSAQGSYITRS